MAGEIRELSQATFISTLAHSWGLHHRDIITSQRPLLLVPSLWVLEFNLWTLVRHKPSVHSIYWTRNSRDGAQRSVSYQVLHVIQMYCLGLLVIPVRLLSRQAALVESFCHSAWNLAGVKGIEIGYCFAMCWNPTGCELYWQYNRHVLCWRSILNGPLSSVCSCHMVLVGLCICPAFVSECLWPKKPLRDQLALFLSQMRHTP